MSIPPEHPEPAAPEEAPSTSAGTPSADEGAAQRAGEAGAAAFAARMARLAAAAAEKSRPHPVATPTPAPPTRGVREDTPRTGETASGARAAPLIAREITAVGEAAPGSAAPAPSNPPSVPAPVAPQPRSTTPSTGESAPATTPSPRATVPVAAALPPAPAIDEGPPAAAELPRPPAPVAPELPPATPVTDSPVVAAPVVAAPISVRVERASSPRAGSTATHQKPTYHRATPGASESELAARTFAAAPPPAPDVGASGASVLGVSATGTPDAAPSAIPPTGADKTIAGGFGPAEPAAANPAIPTVSASGLRERSTSPLATPAAETATTPSSSSAPASVDLAEAGVTPEADADHAAGLPAPAEIAYEPQPQTLRQRFRAWRFASLVEIVATVALALVLAESVQAAVVKPFVIPSQSMEPTLLPGQRVLVNRLAYDFGGTPSRGDIVVFHPPSSLTCKVNVPLSEPCPVSVTTHASDYFVKRVIGLPGDTLSIKNGHPVINGKELTHEPYITPCSDSTSCNMPHSIVIPRGEYYMLGDNRGDSDDSRYWGPVRLSWIIGEVFATYWPIDRIGIF
jgi:signal peptidase I